MGLKALPFELLTILCLVTGCSAAHDVDAERTRIAATVYAEGAGRASIATGTGPALTPTAAPAPTPTPTPSPVPPGVPVPVADEPITLASLDRVEGLALWGRGAVHQVRATSRSGYVALATSFGVEVYRGADLDLLYSLPTEDPVYALAISEEIDALAYVEGDRITIARLSTGEALADVSLGDGDSPAQLLFSPGGSHLAFWRYGPTADGVVRVLATPDWDPITAVRLREGYPGAVAFSHASEYLAISGGFQDGTSVWDLSDGSVVERIEDWIVEDLSGAFSPVTAAFVVHFVGDCTLIDLEQGVPLALLPDPPRTTYDRVFSPDGRYLYLGGSARASAGGQLSAWDTQTGAQRDYPVPSELTHLAIAPAGDILASVTRDGAIQLWRVDGTDLRSLTEFANLRAEDIVLTAGGWLIGISTENAVHTWNVGDRQPVASINVEGFSGPLGDVAFSHGGTYLAASASGGRVAVWRAADGEALHLLQHPDLHTQAAQVGFSHDESTLVGLGSDTYVRWALPQGAAARPFQLQVDSYAYTGPQYTGVLAETADDLLVLLNSSEWREERCSAGPLSGALPSRWMGAASIRQDTLSVRVAGTLTELRQYSCLVANASDAFVNPDRSLLYTVGGAMSGAPCEVRPDPGCVFPPPSGATALGETPGIQAWNWGDGSLAGTIALAADGFVGARIISRDGRFLALIRVGWIDIIDLTSGELMQRISPADAVARDGESDGSCLEPVQVLEFSPDSLLLAAGVGARVAFWDIRTGLLAHVLSGHKGAVTALDFSSDGRLLASASEDGTVRLWGVRRAAGGR